MSVHIDVDNETICNSKIKNCLQWNFFMRIKYVNMVIILFIQLNIQRTVAMKGKLRPQPKINLFKYQYLMRFTKCLFAPVKNDMQENRLACYLVWKKTNSVWFILLNHKQVFSY